MGTTCRTSCVLCAQNCGLEVEVENNRIVKVKGDNSNGKSEGYLCRKGMNIANHQHHDGRLKYPLKRVDGRFERISWDQAIDEIARKLKSIVGQYGPRSCAYMGAADREGTSKPPSANVNRLTKNTNRDRFGTPIHRYVPCRVEAV